MARETCDRISSHRFRRVNAHSILRVAAAFERRLHAVIERISSNPESMPRVAERQTVRVALLLAMSARSWPSGYRPRTQVYLRRSFIRCLTMSSQNSRRTPQSSVRETDELVLELVRALARKASREDHQACLIRMERESESSDLRPLLNRPPV